VPLLIFDPSINKRVDIYETTSAVDLLPTLTNWAGLEMPDWTDGVLLPPYRKSNDESERAIFAVRSHDTIHTTPIKIASTVIIKGRYKLHYYFGYPELDGKELVKLFDVESDPEEMNDLSQVEKDVASVMLAELKLKLQEVNKPYL
jgi:arylsulfatase A-like enzyme